ncbi:MAG: S8 family serine peptidase [Ignavibacteriae bacterium]|nr:S8 family serine peptidase [Ignavibacteriota bacterium]
MRKLRVIYIFILLFTASLAFSANDSSKTKYWIVFADKNGIKEGDNISYNSAAYKSGLELLTERSVNRRLKTFTKENLIEFGDLPLSEEYVQKISSTGIEIIARSRWFNGVSAYLTPFQLDKIKKLDYVTRIFAVKKLYKQRLDNTSPVFLKSYFESLLTDSSNVYDYGKSYNQMMLVNVPPVHNLGITGKGVLVASFDDGFEWRTHESLKGLNVLEEFDFINGDKNTSREKDQKYPDTQSQGGHGTSTLSCLGGFKEGNLIGPAFNSDFILAKTEYVATETPMEEDFWLEAAEWAESYGADVITSSLVYKGFDKPYDENSYTYNDFDGKTSITSIAGDKAAHYGIVVCNATGNYYQTEPPSLGSASDGDSVIGVGAVDKKGVITSFSSNGPTSDGRIKPDVVAPGLSVCVARMGEGNHYDFSNGTSFATPITAGVCALILSAHPELTAMQVREALRNTANNSATPNNVYGWGLINAFKAILYYGEVWNLENAVTVKDNNTTVRIGFASADFTSASSVKFNYRTPKSKKFKSTAMTFTKQLENGNFSGIYECVMNNKGGSNINLEEVEYYFSVNINGKEIKSKSNK